MDVSSEGLPSGFSEFRIYNLGLSGFRVSGFRVFMVLGFRVLSGFRSLGFQGSGRTQCTNRGAFVIGMGSRGFAC